MSRLRTPIEAGEDLGGGTIRCDLTIDAERRKFDVAIANYWRITKWNITGSMTDGTNTDSLDQVYNATVVDELTFSYIQDTVPNPGNARLVGGLTGGPPGNVSLGDNGALYLPVPSLTQATPQAYGLGIITWGQDFDGITAAGKISSNPGGGPLPPVAGTAVCRVPAWNGAGFHSISIPLYDVLSNGLTCTLLIDGIESLEYSNGTPLWNAIGASATVAEPGKESVP